MKKLIGIMIVMTLAFNSYGQAPATFKDVNIKGKLQMGSDVITNISQDTALNTGPNGSTVAVNAAIKAYVANHLGQGWGFNGNSGITNRIGTNDNSSMRFITNGTQTMMLDSIGRLTVYGVEQIGILPNNINNGLRLRGMNNTTNYFTVSTGFERSEMAMMPNNNGWTGKSSWVTAYDDSVKGSTFSSLVLRQNGRLKIDVITGGSITGVTDQNVSFEIYQGGVHRLSTKAGNLYLGTDTATCSSCIIKATGLGGISLQTLTTAQMNALVSPPIGLFINRQDSGLTQWNGAIWQRLFGGGGGGGGSDGNNFPSSITYPAGVLTIARSGTTDITFNLKGSLDATYSAIGHTHTWSSLTSKPTTLSGYGITDAVAHTDAINSYLGFKQTFQSSAGSAAFNLTNVGASDPSSLSNGDIWVTSNILKYREGANTRTVVNTDGTQTISGKTFASNTWPTFNQNTTGSAATLTTSRNIFGVAFNGSADVTGTVTAVYGGTGIASYIVGDMLVAGVGNVFNKITGNITTTKKWLNQTGDGTNSTSPIWSTVGTSDVTGLQPLISQIVHDTTVASPFIIDNSNASGDTIAKLSSNGLQLKTLIAGSGITITPADSSITISAGGAGNIARKIIASNVQITNTTGGTTENTVYTGTIPANSIGVNGSFEIHALWTYPNNANNKTLRCRFNGTAVVSRIVTATVNDRWIGYIANRNSLTSQVSGGAGGGNAVNPASSGTAVSTYSFDTGADITVTLTIQNAVSGDATTSAIEAFEIIAYP